MISRMYVYTDEEAALSANSLNALAYTVNNDIVFAKGQYNPAGNEGRRLLAHELSHVVSTGQDVGSLINTKTSGFACRWLWSLLRKHWQCWYCRSRCYSTSFLEEISIVVAPYTVLAPSPSDANGVLDLAYFFGGMGQGIAIAEIKPNIPTNLITGDLDLFWYEDQLNQHGMTTRRMNLPPPYSPLSFPTLAPADCTQNQLLFVDPPVHGIYTYWCTPDYSNLIRECDCRTGRRCKKRQVNQACRTQGCDAQTTCGSETMILENCGSGTGPTCPPSTW